MAVVGKTYLNLKDKLSQTENGKVTSTIIDLIAADNVLIEDAIVVECNEGSYHKTTVRNGLPTIQFRKFYQGVAPSKSEHTQITETTGMLEAYSQVDKALADLNGDKDQFRLNEATAFIQAMNKTVQENIFYGNKGTNDATFDGLAVRYKEYSDKKDTVGYQVINAGGTGNNNTSIWFVGWGELNTHLLYPKGSQAGLKHEDKGVQTTTDSNGNMYDVYRDKFSWDVGLAVRNYKSNVRIANIDVTKLEGEDAIDLITLMVKAYHRFVKHAKNTKNVIYVTDTIATYLHLQAAEKKNVNLTMGEFAGQPVVKFLGIPVKTCDYLNDNEQAVPAAKK